MSEYGGTYEPQRNQPSQAPKPPKRHTVRNVVIGMFVGILLVAGGCTAIIGGALSSVDTKAPVTATSKATPVDNGPTPDPVTTPTDHYTPTVTVPPSPKVTHKPAPAMTASQEQAVGTAEDYLRGQSFSRKGLIEQLQYEGFSAKDATFGVDYLKANWSSQAVGVAKGYLRGQHFSRSGLIEQLEYEGFTHAQAVYGVTKAGL